MAGNESGSTTLATATSSITAVTEKPTAQPQLSTTAPTSTSVAATPAADSFVRDPHKLVAYIVPLPTPTDLPPLPAHVAPPPLRFVLYTPAPPPLLPPREGDARERPAERIQRMWQEEVREAHTSGAPVASWHGIKARVTKGISWAVGQTTSADLDFLTRIPRDGSVHHVHGKAKEKEKGGQGGGEKGDKAVGKTATEDDHDAEKLDVPSDSDSESISDHDDGNDHDHPTTTCRTVRLDEMVLIYPPNMKMTPDELRVEFVSSLMRTKSKAERDTVIATGLLPVTAALDWALVFVGWVFGGALEVNAVWAASSFRGAKMARSVTQRLASSTDSALRLSFVASPLADTLQAFLLGACIARNKARFDCPHWQLPTEADVMDAIGWNASGSGGRREVANWEDEAWERGQVVADLRTTMRKAAKSWDKWCGAYAKNPERATTR